MEQLYPQNILERHYPILREQREKEERKADEEKLRLPMGMHGVNEELESRLYENEPQSSGTIGLQLNTFA
ncbi:hypothetical protein [Pelagicoccus sp. SDUM812003]|uniref:hypothetical protein n=1 Tax=Pelagicoccus sp. SDUM812003 TaxID=3041267 RepID=UPI00280E1323|nr:hypothetical protein [Pelagicoccus sp. SDUM812003]MDQ8203373.1 hypothetical protein [Pelagicoccus sp. SDUM812003]